MKNLMSKVIVVAAAICLSCSSLNAYGRPYHRPPLYGPRMHYHMHPYHHHHSWWGPGGRYFWPGFTAGVIGSALYRSYAAPVPVVQPVVVQQPQVVVPAAQPVTVVTQPAVVPAPAPAVIVR